MGGGRCWEAILRLNSALVRFSSGGALSELINLVYIIFLLLAYSDWSELALGASHLFTGGNSTETWMGDIISTSQGRYRDRNLQGGRVSI